jgi:uncharacterized membrane protein
LEHVTSRDDHELQAISNAAASYIERDVQSLVHEHELHLREQNHEHWTSFLVTIPVLTAIVIFLCCYGKPWFTFIRARLAHYPKPNEEAHTTENFTNPVNEIQTEIPTTSSQNISDVTIRLPTQRQSVDKQNSQQEFVTYSTQSLA